MFAKGQVIAAGKAETKFFVKRILFTAILAAFFISTIFPVASLAAEPSQGLTVTPPTFELSANPGDTIRNSIRVDNLTDTPLNITTALKNFTALGEEGQVGLNEEESGFSLVSWIKTDPRAAEIPAKGSRIFTFTIQIPANAEPGGRFGAIVFKTDIKPAAGSGMAIGQEIGALLMLRLAGKVNEKAHIETFKSLRSFQEYGPVNFEARIKNDGNVHVKPTGTITVTNLFGGKVATIPVDAKNALPQAMRKLHSKWDKTSLFGKYTATLSLQYGNQQILTSSTTFTVIPYRMVLVVLVVALAVGAVLYMRRQRILKALRILLGKE
jgi:hypothetical protein